MNPLLRLQQHGQSYWVDNLTRKMITGGDLKRRVADRGLRGVTSNPAIFEKAITGSRDYDDQIESLVSNDCSTQEIYESLVTSDVRDACDVLRPVFDEPEGADGYVSLEVSPHLAHDTKGSIDEAKRLYALVNRPNLFIKIPATSAGVSAIGNSSSQGYRSTLPCFFPSSVMRQSPKRIFAPSNGAPRWAGVYAKSLRLQVSF